MDAKSKATATAVRKNGLGMLSIRKLVMGLNPNQKWVTVFSACSGDGLKNKFEIEKIKKNNLEHGRENSWASVANKMAGFYLELLKKI